MTNGQFRLGKMDESSSNKHNQLSASEKAPQMFRLLADTRQWIGNRVLWELALMAQGTVKQIMHFY